MRTIALVTLLSLLISCRSNPHWTLFSSNGLPEHGETYEDLYFNDEQTGYIGGSHLTLLRSNDINKTNFQNTAVLYKTLNQGKDWKQISLPFFGSVDKILSFGDTLILNIRTEHDTSLLVQSNNNGKTWRNLLTFTNYGRIIEMEFISSNNGKMLTTDRQNQYLVIYHDNTFDTVQNFHENYPRALLKDKVISLKHIPSTANYSGYFLTDLNNGRIKEMKFDKSYYISSHYKSNGNLYLAASKKNVGYILKLNETGYEEIELGKYSSYTPGIVLVYDDKLIVLANKESEGSPIEITRSFLISTDKGKTWNKENLPSPICYSAPAIYRDKFFISAACPPGYFQMRRLR